MAAGAGLLLLVICRAYGLIVVDLGDVRWSPMHKLCPALKTARSARVGTPSSVCFDCSHPSIFESASYESVASVLEDLSSRKIFEHAGN